MFGISDEKKARIDKLCQFQFNQSKGYLSCEMVNLCVLETCRWN